MMYAFYDYITWGIRFGVIRNSMKPTWGGDWGLHSPCNGPPGTNQLEDPQILPVRNVVTWSGVTRVGGMYKLMIYSVSAAIAILFAYFLKLHFCCFLV